MQLQLTVEDLMQIHQLVGKIDDAARYTKIYDVVLNDLHRNLTGSGGGTRPPPPHDAGAMRGWQGRRAAGTVGA